MSILICLAACTAPVGDHHPEWKKYYDEQGVSGCISIFDLKESRFIDYNPDRCAQRFIPASTFKIFNALIALETKTIPDTSFVLPWDSTIHPVETWNSDQSLGAAFRHSTVWYFQEIAQRIGARKLGQYMNLLHYGNAGTSGTVDSFWLNGDLRISADEQVEFLKNLYLEQLPLSRRSQQLVKAMMLRETKPGYTVSSKTGWAFRNDPLANTGESKISLGWYIGWVTTPDNVYVFALNMDATNPAPPHFAEARIRITEKCLQDAGIIPAVK